METLFDVLEEISGMTYVSEDKLFTSWKLYVREDVPMPDKPLYLNTCYKHVNEAIEQDYVLNFTYDFGFGRCDLCK